MAEKRIRNHKRQFITQEIMNSAKMFPTFDDYFSELNRFILGLVNAYEMGRIKSWDALEERVNVYFTPERMEHMESVVPGWQKMASFSDRITLVHVLCVFLGLFMLPEFQRLSPEQQQLAKWTVLFHDLAKLPIRGKRDTTHAFHSAILAARQLPLFEFAINTEYYDLISSWSELTYKAAKISENFPEPIQDNEKLSAILMGVERMFGKDTPTALIVQCVLLHMSINVVRDWPQAAPLSNEEIKRYITNDLEPLLKVMMLSDNEGWVMFSSERQQQRNETLQVFEMIERLISI